MPQPPDQTEDQPKPWANAAIHIADLTDPSGCTVVPNGVLDDDQLGPETRLVYVMLRRLAATGDGRPLGQRQLARRIGIPPHRLPRHLALLERVGLIRVDGRSSARTPIRYRLEAPAAHNSDPPSSPRARPPQVRPGRGAIRANGLSLLDRLIVLGVDPQVAGRLVVTYPRARVAGALRAAHRRHPPPRDLAAWVVAAIRQGWVAPTAADVARQRQAAQEQAIATWEHRADAALAALPVETQQSLRRQAAEVVERRFDQRLATTTIGAMLVTAEVRRLVAEQVGMPVPEGVTVPDLPARSEPSSGG